MVICVYFTNEADNDNALSQDREGIDVFKCWTDTIYLKDNNKNYKKLKDLKTMVRLLHKNHITIDLSHITVYEDK